MDHGDDSPDRSSRTRTAVALAIVLAVGFLAYSRTFDVPWYFDDVYAIVENPRVHSPAAAVSSFFETRGLAWLTFALNAAWTGTSVAAFHATNLAIHLATGVLAFLLLLKLLGERRDLALLGALVFVAHPLQTQAVTYIVQRGASLAGLLCLSAVAAYLGFRRNFERERSWRPMSVWAPYAGALLAGWLGILAKESAAVLPGLLLLVELVMAGGRQGGSAWRRCLPVIPFVFAPVRVFYPILFARAEPSAGVELHGISSFEAEALGSAEVSPIAYFATELEVVWRYLRRIVLPIGQVFDLGLLVDRDPFRWTVLAAGAGVAALAGLAWALRRRSPPIALGIGWFFVALSVESTFIPLDAYFEHRLYLPMFGVAMIVPFLLDRLLAGDRRRIAAAGVVLVVLLCALTLRRNEIWRDPVRLWRADLEHGSQSYRSAIGLADALYARGDAAEAQAAYRAFVARADTRCRAAPCGARYLLNAGVAYERLAEPSRAADYYRRAATAQPGYARAHYNLGVLLYRSGNIQGALAEFARAAKLSPGDASALFNWATVALELGNRVPAERVLAKLRTISPERARRLEEQLAGAPAGKSP